MLTEWNGLLLSTLAEAARRHRRADWLDAAVANGEFLLADLRRADGRWLRSWQADGGARHLAYAADYARRSSTPSCAWPKPPARPAWIDEPRPDRRRACSSCSGTTNGAACSPPATTPRR